MTDHGCRTSLDHSESRLDAGRKRTTAMLPVYIINCFNFSRRITSTSIHASIRRDDDERIACPKFICPSDRNDFRKGRNTSRGLSLTLQQRRDTMGEYEPNDPRDITGTKPRSPIESKRGNFSKGTGARDDLTRLQNALASGCSWNAALADLSLGNRPDLFKSWHTESRASGSASPAFARRGLRALVPRGIRGVAGASFALLEQTGLYLAPI